jgi:hypothetical protein
MRPEPAGAGSVLYRYPHASKEVEMGVFDPFLDRISQSQESSAEAPSSGLASAAMSLLGHRNLTFK